MDMDSGETIYDISLDNLSKMALLKPLLIRFINNITEGKKLANFDEDGVIQRLHYKIRMADNNVKIINTKIRTSKIVINKFTKSQKMLDLMKNLSKTIDTMVEDVYKAFEIFDRKYNIK